MSAPAIVERLSLAPPDGSVQAVTRMLQQQLDATGCAVSLAVDNALLPWSLAGRRWLSIASLRESFCGWAMRDDVLLEIPNISADPRCQGLAPTIDGEPVQFYAGIPLRLDEEVVGTLCVVDLRPRTLTFSDRQLLIGCARVIEETLRLCRVNEEFAAMGRLLDGALEEAYLVDVRADRFVHASSGALDRLGCTMDELRKLAPSALSPRYSPAALKELLRDSGQLRREELRTEHRRRDGRSDAVGVLVAPARHDGRVLPDLAVIVAYDIAERLEKERELGRLAHHDPLTGLANRHLLSDRFHVARSQARRLNHHLALALIDLDRFKELNDTRGHEAGDAALTHLARILEQCVRAEDTVARLGGDEFVVLFGGLSGPREAATLSTRLRCALESAIFKVTGEPLPFSLGLAVQTASRAELASLMKEADRRMYAEKGDQAARRGHPVSRVALVQHA